MADGRSALTVKVSGDGDYGGDGGDDDDDDNDDDDYYDHDDKLLR